MGISSGVYQWCQADRVIAIRQSRNPVSWLRSCPSVSPATVVVKSIQRKKDNVIASLLMHDVVLNSFYVVSIHAVSFFYGQSMSNLLSSWPQWLRSQTVCSYPLGVVRSHRQQMSLQAQDLRCQDPLIPPVQFRQHHL